MEEEETPAMALPARATRGKRMTKLVAEDLEADEEFWNQDALKDAAEDVEYEEEGGGEDVFDSDFDDDESEGNEEADDDYEKPRKKRKLPPGSKRPPAKHLRAKYSKGPAAAASLPGITSLEEAAAAAAEGRDAGRPPPGSGGERAIKTKRPSEVEQLGGNGGGGAAEYAASPQGPSDRRKSTRTVVLVKDIEREAIRAKQGAVPKPVKRKKCPEDERKWTQEEMLLEAAQTEVKNRQTLEIMLAREEEVKRRAVIHKETYSGPTIRFTSKGGKNLLEFIGVTALPDAIDSQAPRYPKRASCAVTGLPAKYRDPRTGLPYANKEAYKALWAS